jgi:desulfoferrodoxin (superoxide reductase-like protein)
VIRLRTRPAIIAAQGAQIQRIDDLDDKTRQVPFGKPFINRRRQQKTRLPVNVTKIAHRNTDRHIEESII